MPPPATLKPYQQLPILKLLALGMGIRAIEEFTEEFGQNRHRDTILKYLCKAGFTLDAFHDENIRNVPRDHWEIDETWTFVRKKERNLTDEEKAEGILGDQYLYLAIGQETKFILCYLVGKKTEATTREFMDDLAWKCALRPRITRHQISTDGFDAYPPAIAEAFKGNVNYGSTSKKPKKDRRPMFPKKYIITGYFDARKITTSHVERCNLTIRQFIKRFNRETLSFSKSLRNLRAAVALAICQARLHRCRLLDRAVLPAEVVMGDMQCHGSDQVLQFLREPKGQSGETTNMIADRQVIPFDMRRANIVLVQITRYYSSAAGPNVRRAVTTGVRQFRPVILDDNPIVRGSHESLLHGVRVWGKPIR
jgi:IS1 family transposase